MLYSLLFVLIFNAYAQLELLPCDDFEAVHQRTQLELECESYDGDFTYSCQNLVDPFELAYAEVTSECNVDCNSKWAQYEVTIANARKNYPHPECLEGEYLGSARCVNVVADPPLYTIEIEYNCYDASLYNGYEVPDNSYGGVENNELNALNSFRYENDANLTFIGQELAHIEYYNSEMWRNSDAQIEQLEQLDNALERVNDNMEYNTQAIVQEGIYNRYSQWRQEDRLEEIRDAIQAQNDNEYDWTPDSPQDCDFLPAEIKNQYVECTTSVDADPATIPDDYFNTSSSGGVSDVSEVELAVNNSAFKASIDQNFNVTLTETCPNLSVNFCGFFGGDCTISICDTRFYIWGMHPFEFFGQLLIIASTFYSWLIIFRAFKL